MELEYEYHMLAQERGVPVAPIVTDRLLRPTVRCVQFYVLATYFVGERHVPRDSVCLHAAALVSAVADLHDKTG